MSTTVTASDGFQLDIESLPQAFTYSGSNITKITIVVGPKTYVQTFTYTGSNVTAISNWVLQ